MNKIRAAFMKLLFLFFCQFNHFQILELAVVNGEAYQSAYFMETINAGSARVDVKHVQGLVVLHLEDM